MPPLIPKLKFTDFKKGRGDGWPNFRADGLGELHKLSDWDKREALVVLMKCSRQSNGNCMSGTNITYLPFLMRFPRLLDEVFDSIESRMEDKVKLRIREAMGVSSRALY